MTALPAKTSISDTYPLPSNATARAGFATLWDVFNEFTEKSELDLASAATCDIGGQASTKLRITGTTTITSFGANYRGPIQLRMSGIVTLTHNATTLRCPGSTNITTGAGDLLMAWPTATVSGTLDGWQAVILARGNGGVEQGQTFSAYAATDQSVTSNTWTKATLGTEEFDTASCFASSKFTPTVAGYYLITGAIRGNSTTLTGCAAAIYKNGASFKYGDVKVITSASTTLQSVVSAVIYFNGSTDYVELYGNVIGGTPVFKASLTPDATSHFSGCFMRPA